MGRHRKQEHFLETHHSNRFDRDTAVTLVEEGTYSTRFDPGWWIIRGPNGGYLAAILQRAITAAVDDVARLPRSLTVHYTSPPTEGEALIETRVERRGGSLSTVTARVTQAGKLRALALAACSTPRESHAFYHAEMPDVPPADSLARGEAAIPLHERYDYRFIPSMQPNAANETAVMAAWIRAETPRPLDHPMLAAYSDALPPAVFARAHRDQALGALPTVDLTIHYRMDPAETGVRDDEHCLAIFRSRLAHGGYIEEDGEIWSADGQLLAQSRQLAVILG